MLAVSSGFRAALAAPQRVTVRADVSKAGVRLFSDLPVLGGSIDVDASSITRRRLDLVVAPRLSTGTYTDIPAMPRKPSDPLGHYGQEVSVQWGLTYPDGTTEWVPLGVFRIESVRGSLLDDEPVRITGVSREAFVSDARYAGPYTNSSPSAQSLIAEVIHGAMPNAVVQSRTGMDRRVPLTTWDEDRWGVVTDLAQSIAAVVYCDPYGRFIIADAPTVTSAPVWRVAAGPGGVLVAASSSSSRSRVYNGVVVRGESPSSDSPPVRAFKYDDRPGSPTLWGDPDSGAFGARPRFMYLPTVTTQEQADAVALANLAKHLGASSTLDVSAVPNVALEAGDVIEVITDPADPAGSVRRHVVDNFTVPLEPGGNFVMSTRDVGDVSDV
jgi:hypothetical protein